MLVLSRILAIILICLTFSPGCLKVNPDAAGPTSLSEVTMASAVTADGQPLAVASTFLANTPNVYVTARVNNAPEGTTVGVKWVYLKDASGNAQNQQLAEESAGSRAHVTYPSAGSRSPAPGAAGSIPPPFRLTERTSPPRSSRSTRCSRRCSRPPPSLISGPSPNQSWPGRPSRCHG